MQFKHFIITLFNLKIWKEDKKGEITRTEKWLKQRFKLFEEFCLPSVKGQTQQNFTWLCLLDENTPQVYKNRIEKHCDEVPQLKICYISETEARQMTDDRKDLKCRFLRDIIRDNLNSEDVYVITTNLDNDDALNINMVERLHKEFLSSPKEAVISFNLGLQYFTEINAIMQMKYPHNHFMNLIERTDKDFHTVEYYSHTKIRKELHHIDIMERPYWMEVVHGHNVNNDLRITSRISYKPQISTFSFSEYGIERKIKCSTNMCNFIFRIPCLFMRIAVWRIKKKIARLYLHNRT